MKKIGSLVLAFILCLMQPYSVLADTDGIVGNNPLTYLAYVFNQLGCVVTGDFEQAVLNDERIQKYANGESQFVTETKDDEGKTIININQNFINDVKETINVNISSQDGYRIIPHVDATVEKVYGGSLDVAQHVAMVKKWNEIQPLLLYNYNFDTGSALYLIQLPVDFYTENSVLYYYNGLKAYSLDSNSSFDSYPFSGFYDFFSNRIRKLDRYQIPSISISNITATTGDSIKYFNNADDLYRYLNYQSKCYISSSSMPDFSNGLSVPKETFDSIDWNKLNRDIYDTVNQAIQNEKSNNDSFSASDAEKIIEDKIGELLQAMGSLNEGQLDENQSLEEILAQITADGERQSGWLAKIYALLEEKLEILIENGFGGGSGSQEINYGEQLDAILLQLEKSNDILGDIESNTGKIIAILGLDTAVSIFDLISQRFADSTDTAKSKFPTSIPWDVIAVVEVMKSDPVTPVFDYPIQIESLGIQESVHIDLTNMEKLSKLSRTLLSLTFILFLVTLTRKMFFNGGNQS